MNMGLSKSEKSILSGINQFRWIGKKSATHIFLGSNLVPTSHLNYQQKKSASVVSSF